MIGRIYKIIAGYYDIKFNDQIIRVRGSGKLRMQETSPVVGDYVNFDDSLDSVLERKNVFIRPKVANVDQVLITTSLVQPNLNTFLLDKYLAIANLNYIDSIILLTKYDLVEKDDQYIDFYQNNFIVFKTSHDNPSSYENLKEVFKDKTTIFMGQSGVGKTTMLNKLTDSFYETQAISKALNRGKHTTRVVEMFDFLSGQIVDTPGFGTVEINAQKIDVARSFIFFKNYEFKCKYRTCLHINENEIDCCVKQAVSENKIPLWRYQNYIKIINEIKK